jgi:hypothetical protein
LKNFLLLSLTSFVFSVVLWVVWHFVDSHVLFVAGKGGFFYFPHAARVLCVVYFGWRSIPALYLGELVGPYVINPDMYSFSILLSSFLSVMSVPLAIILLNSSGLTLGQTRSSPLNRRNYKHIFLITFISAVFNALLVNLYLSRNNFRFPNAITDIEQVYRFLIGDIIGTLFVFLLLATLLIPVIRQARS